MPKGYVIARATVTNPGAWAEYAAKASEAIKKYGGNPIVRGGRAETIEGQGVARNVVIKRPPRPVGPDGLKLSLDTGTGSLEALGWGLANRVNDLQQGARVDIAFRLERDDYRGESYLQARIADVRVSEA